MSLYRVSILLLLLLSSFSMTTASSDDPTDVSIDCGSPGTSAVHNGREWRGDVKEKFSSLVEMKGSSTASSVIGGHKFILDPIPYKTARFSRSWFSYTFRVNPGQKILRFHFNSAPYKRFKRYNDFFAVEAGSFTLLNNFSVSLAADALGVSSLVKEFLINIEENQLLHVVFSPASSPLQDTYTFINGIEILSVPIARSYFHMEEVGAPIVGKSPIYIDNNNALEIIQRLNIRQDSVSMLNDGISDEFGMLGSAPKQKGSWKISVDVGFRYLVRLHFSNVRFKVAGLGGSIFEVHINQKIANTTLDRVEERHGDSIHWYRDYVMVMRGSRHEGKRDILICLQSNDEAMDGHGALRGFEILKVSNIDNSLASLNPLPSLNDSSYQIVRVLLKVLGFKNAIVSFAIVVLVLGNMTIYKLSKFQEGRSVQEKNMPSIKDKVCRQFSLVEIQLATEHFSHAHLIGTGGFGKVYKGIIDNGQEVVAIKRLEPNSSQGTHEFLTEIETLTKLRHDNLVALIGYCKDHKEMILIYEFMACGTLADHLFKLGLDSNNRSSLSWKQCLNICIGAARGLEYLHTGHSIIHRDVKASNILLDEDFTAKVSDFGLAKHLGTRNLQQSHVSTRVKGTLGYFDPEYLTTGKLTRKSDTYSFGVVLLEVLSGRRAVDHGLKKDEQLLIKWAQDKISKGKAGQIVASCLRGQISRDSLKAFVDIAERCLHSEPKKRPTMAQVVGQLESALQEQESSKSILSTDALEQQESSKSTVSSDALEQLESALQEEASKDVYDVTVESPTGTKGQGEVRNHKKAFRFSWGAFWNRSRQPTEQELSLLQSLPPEIRLGMNNGAKKFTLKEMKQSTGNFSKGKLIANGVYGDVYRGFLRKDKRWVNIKRARQGSMQGPDGLVFRTEIELLSRVYHNNIVCLIGFCLELGEQIVVYEYIPESLKYRLSDRKMNGPRPSEDHEDLNWMMRLQIAFGVAKGVRYLHYDAKPRIIHGDIRSENILLWGRLPSSARIANFRVAKPSWFESEGTMGYLDPEYFLTDKLNEKSDVYSFGILLLELLTSNPPILKGEHIIQLVKRTMNTTKDMYDLQSLLDPIVSNCTSPRSVERVVDLALRCVQTPGANRPPMGQVVEEIQNIRLVAMGREKA